MTTTTKKFARGAAVKFRRRNDEMIRGSVTATKAEANGTWVFVDTKGAGTIKVRPSQLKPV